MVCHHPVHQARPHGRCLSYWMQWTFSRAYEIISKGGRNTKVTELWIFAYTVSVCVKYIGYCTAYIARAFRAAKTTWLCLASLFLSYSYQPSNAAPRAITIRYRTCLQHEHIKMITTGLESVRYHEAAMLSDPRPIDQLSYRI